jgi:hypothetical protein
MIAQHLGKRVLDRHVESKVTFRSALRLESDDHLVLSATV